MKFSYHPEVQRDVEKILRYYDRFSRKLGDEFWEELSEFIQLAGDCPKRFHFERPNRRRVNLKRFPYHFLFRETSEGIRITVVRHNRQHPGTGARRL